jgi:hypothetical protein
MDANNIYTTRQTPTPKPEIVWRYVPKARYDIAAKLIAAQRLKIRHIAKELLYFIALNPTNKRSPI